MVKVLNKTSHQRIYALTDETTLRVGAFDYSEPLADELICDHLRSDADVGLISLVSVSPEINDTAKNYKGGKK